MDSKGCVKFFFGRFQPPHSGHFDIIEKTVKNNSSKCKIFVFVSPKTSRDDLQRGTYGKYESEDRYPLTSDERRGIIIKELERRGIDEDVDVLTTARSAQGAIKDIMRMTGVEPEDIDIVLGEDERGPFSASFRGKPQLGTHDDRRNHPEKYVGMEIFHRDDVDVSATKIRNQLIDIILASDLDTRNILSSINNNSFLSSVLPQDTDSRITIIESYKDKIMDLSKTRPFGRYSALALGGKRSKRRQTKRRRHRKSRKHKTTRR